MTKKRWLGLICFLLLCWVGIYVFPVSPQEKPKVFQKEVVLVMAHQGGASLAPSSTMPAFLNAVKLGVDMIEFDVHITKDGELVAIHDATVDRTTNGTGKVNEMTLKEIQQLDAGAKFKDVDGNYSFKKKGVQIPTVHEVFEKIPNMHWNIEIKDTNNPVHYREITEKLWALMEEYSITDVTLLASFDWEITQLISEVSDGKAIVAGDEKETTQFVLLHKLFLNGLYRGKVDAIEIPVKQSGIKLDDRKLIKAAKQRGIDVHYWTINDADTMEHLIDIGVDGILTDRPDLLIEVIEKRRLAK